MRTRHATSWTRPMGLALLAATLLLGACASDPADDPTGTDDGPSTQEGSGDAESPDDGQPGDEDADGPDAGEGSDGASPAASDAVPDTPAGAQLAWILDAIDPDGAQPTPGEVADRLAPPLNGMITPSQLLDSFDDLRARGPWDVVNDPAHGVQLTAELRNAQDDQTVLINLSVGDEGKMVGLFLAGDE